MEDKPGSSEHVADMIERLGRLARVRRHADRLNAAQWDALRFLARANRYSRSPGAIGTFLATTKGTASQTVSALCRKKLIDRAIDPRDRRRVRLEILPRGREVLAGGPAHDLAAAASEMAPTDRSALVAGLNRLLGTLQRRNDRQSFGLCGTCRFFRRDDASDSPNGPHRCGLTLEPLSDAETALICAEHSAAEKIGRG
ncbi:MAG: MarR family transcriptional regulator [Rhodospirillaceae bacterium]|nr:MarR family transcriptional regulator [Rhodospirillaceae bacterium]